MRRSSEIAALSKLVREKEPGLAVAAIVGPGGVGKSYLLDEVFRLEKPAELGFMHLSVDASNPQTRNDFFGLIDGQLAARSLPPPARPDYDYFPQLRAVAGLYRDMVEKARDELGRSGAPVVVNEDTIRSVLGEDDDPAVIQSWFEHEASIRDPAARDFTIRPLIREKALRYLASRSPSRHRAMLDRAAKAPPPPAGGDPS